MWVYWIIAAIIFALIELATPTFFIIWFSVGAIISSIISIFIENIAIQLIIFSVISTILIFSTKTISQKLILNKKLYKSNVDKLIGKTGLVIQKIDNIKNTGRITIGGESWKATSSEIIEVDSLVKVDSIEGVTVTVSLSED